MEFVVRPLTPDLWPALEDLFGTTGPVGRCWCMYWRLGNKYRDRQPDENRDAFHEVVDQGPPPGLVAFDEDLAVGGVSSRPVMPCPGSIRRGASSVRTMFRCGRSPVSTFATVTGRRV